MKRRKCVALVLAAGQGKRLGGKVHKQYLELEGKPILYYSLMAFQNSPLIDRVVLVTGVDEVPFCREEIVEKYGLTKVDTIVVGGAERFASAWKGLQALNETIDEETRRGIVFIHDGVRPFINEEMLLRAYEAVEKYHACVVGMPSKDTIKIADDEGYVSYTPRRSRVWNVQTPQVFDFTLAYRAYAALARSGRTDVTDDAMIVETFTSARVKLVEGSYENIKITTPEDLDVSSAFLRKH